MIAFAALGGAKTTRQGRGAAIAAAVAGVVALRIAGFGASSLAVRSASLTIAIYAVPVGATVAAGALAWRSMLGAARTPDWAKAIGCMADDAAARVRNVPMPRRLRAAG
jgi:lipopolysaccharide export system permease protein